MPIIIMNMVNISLRYGHIGASAYGYVCYGFILSCFMGDYEQGYQYGYLGLKLNEKLNDRVFRCKVLMTFTSTLKHWRDSLQSGFSLLKQSYQAGLESGDLLWAGYAITAFILNRFSKGETLQEVYRVSENYVPFLQQVQNPALTLAQITQQSILNLQGLTDNPYSLSNNRFDETNYLEMLETNGDAHGIHWYSSG